jgi:hypothetical protein
MFRISSRRINVLATCRAECAVVTCSQNAIQYPTLAHTTLLAQQAQQNQCDGHKI